MSQTKEEHGRAGRAFRERLGEPAKEKLESPPKKRGFVDSRYFA